MTEPTTRTLDVPDDLRVGAGAAPPREVLSTTYEQMTGLGLDLGPYTRLAEHFLARIRGTRPPAGNSGGHISALRAGHRADHQAGPARRARVQHRE